MGLDRGEGIVPDHPPAASPEGSCPGRLHRPLAPLPAARPTRRSPFLPMPCLLGVARRIPRHSFHNICESLVVPQPQYQRTPLHGHNLEGRIEPHPSPGNVCFCLASAVPPGTENDYFLPFAPFSPAALLTNAVFLSVPSPIALSRWVLAATSSPSPFDNVRGHRILC